MDRAKKDILELTRISVEDYLHAEKLPLKLLADNVRSMMNIGSFFRTADAFALQEIVLCGISGCPPHAEISKTALGAEHSVAWRYSASAVAECRSLQQQGWRILVLEQTHNSVMLQHFEPSKDEKYVLVVGNEVNGVEQEIVDLADTVLEIPQYGTKHSLNVSVSGGIAIYALAEKLTLHLP